MSEIRALLDDGIPASVPTKLTGTDPPVVVLVHGLGIFRFEIGEVGLGVGGSGGALDAVDSALTTANPSYSEGNRPLGTPIYQHI